MVSSEFVVFVESNSFWRTQCPGCRYRIKRRRLVAVQGMRRPGFLASEFGRMGAWPRGIVLSPLGIVGHAEVKGNATV